MVSMTEQPSAGADRRVQRAIVLVLLGEKDESRYSCAQLACALGAGEQTLEPALARLLEMGLIGREGGALWASPAARHMDELGLIAI
jgi:hypothetical protein